MAEVKLYGSFFSPFSNRVEMALNLKGVKYEFIQEDLSNKSHELVKYNPVHKKVPVLVHNGKAVCESLVILEYIDEAFEGPPILPKDPYDRATARFWGKFIDDKCMSPMWKACASSGEDREKLKAEAIDLLKFLDDELKGKKFFGGETIGYVDIAANFIGYWFVIVSGISGVELLTKENHPNLCQWIDEYVNDDFVKGNLPEKEKLTAGLKAIMQPPKENEYRPKV